MALFDLMGSVFRGLFDPTALAREMAQMNVSPDELMQHMQKTQQLQTMPTSGAQTTGGGNGGFFDLPSQAGRNRDLSNVDNTMMNFFKMLSGNTGSNANEQQQQGTPIPSGGMSKTPNSLGNLMQPATQATPNANGPTAAQALQPLPPPPPQLQGLPPQHGNIPNVPQNAMPAAPQMPLPPNAMQAPNSSPMPLGLAMQPNTQPPQPNVGGVERPGAAPHMNADATGIRDAAMKTFYSGGVTNPFGLAALASTGQHESGFNPANMNRTWNDPSQSGKSGTSGGMFSWRNERLTALQNFAKANGESGNGSPETQAKFFMQEDPNTIQQLNSAKSADEAQQIMNKNIAFAGYDKSTGEASRRMQTARTLVPQMEQFTGKPSAQVTSAVPPVNPNAGAVGPATGPTDYTKGPFGFLDALSKSDNSGGQEDLNLPKPPSPVAPSPGRYDVNPQAMQLMLAMLGPMAGGAQIPSLQQLMAGR